MLALLRNQHLKSGSGCPDPYGPSREEGEVGDAKQEFEAGVRGRTPEVWKVRPGILELTTQKIHEFNFLSRLFWD